MRERGGAGEAERAPDHELDASVVVGLAMHVSRPSRGLLTMRDARRRRARGLRLEGDGGPAVVVRAS